MDYTLPGPSTFVFNVALPATAFQKVETETLTIMPELPVDEFTDPEGGSRYQRLEASGGKLTLQYRATVASEPAVGPPEGIAATPPAKLPPRTLPYIVPSRHCESDLLMRLSWREFDYLPETIERPARIADWIHDNIDYLTGTTESITSAFNTVT